MESMTWMQACRGQPAARAWRCDWVGSYSCMALPLSTYVCVAHMGTTTTGSMRVHSTAAGHYHWAYLYAWPERIAVLAQKDGIQLWQPRAESWPERIQEGPYVLLSYMPPTIHAFFCSRWHA
eukprot:11089-Pelagomonas_calceolata.AAC.5